jgi:FKBP-type peptidyl-prolyl cis-trans isomerase
MNFNKKYTLIALLGSVTFLISCFKENEIFDPLEQFNEEQAAIGNYISANNLDANIESTYKLRYVVNGEGDSLRTKSYDSMTVTYSLRHLSTGAEIVSAENVILKLDDQIAGWRILMPLIKQGGDITMFIPSYYAYGQLGGAGVPANSTLILDVSLIKIHHLTADEQFNYDQNRISNYLITNSLTALEDSVFGIKYSVIGIGTGEQPAVTDEVNVTYTGYVLNDRDLTLDQFDSNTRITFDLNQLIKGWQLLLPYVKAGGEIRMYLPSKYGYGTDKLEIISSNAVLIFNVKLNSIQ